MKPSASSRRAFTLIELLTVIAIIGILAAILIPTVGKVRDSSKRAKCMSNVRQITLGLTNLANQNKNQAYPVNDPKNGGWAWDVGHKLAASISANAWRDVFYCPSSNMLDIYSNNMNAMWEYGPQKDTQGQLDGWAVTSYVILVTGTKKIRSDYLNDRIRPEYSVPIKSTILPASRRPLVVDATISDSSALTSFAKVSGGLKDNLSNHMQSGMCSGAHTGFVDGHVKWRSFMVASPTNPDGFEQRDTGTSPRFWF